jgi:hypothetical protein
VGCELLSYHRYLLTSYPMGAPPQCSQPGASRRYHFRGLVCRTLLFQPGSVWQESTANDHCRRIFEWLGADCTN